MSYPKDCNDKDRDIQRMDAWDGELRCGDVFDVVDQSGADRLNVVECEKIKDARNSGVSAMSGTEVVYGFSHPESTDVMISPVDPEFGVFLWAIRGIYCDDYCTTEIDLDLSFRVEANEQWFVVASTQDLLADAIEFQVDCLADIE